MEYKTNFSVAGVNEQTAQLQQQSEANKQAVKKNAFDANEYNKKYLKAYLASGETQRTFKFRLLPITPDATTAYQVVKAHSIMRQPANGGKSRPMTYVCPKTEDPNAPCPFCEIASEANKKKWELTDLLKKEADPITQAMLKKQIETYDKVGKANYASEKYIVRGIERGNPEYGTVDEGPKWWMFDKLTTGKGIKDNIDKLSRNAIEDGLCDDIYNLSTGHDLRVELTKAENGNRLTSVSLVTKPCSLTENYEQGWAWINDQTTWKQLWPIKPYEFLQIIASGKTPYYDKVSKKYITKEEYEANTADRSFGDVVNQPIPEQYNKFAPGQQYVQPAQQPQVQYPQPSAQPQQPALVQQSQHVYNPQQGSYCENAQTDNNMFGNGAYNQQITQLPM